MRRRKFTDVHHGLAISQAVPNGQGLQNQAIQKFGPNIPLPQCHLAFAALEGRYCEG